ncbi:hypothetical protein GCM10009835_34140 [Planosporangium flavigriseum]|uniref:Uncharacterized protein n=1 Tax=Planosporangium flavigriseum TaxID=373681 RepID=A0A8J3LK57_9ACTN|nr:hypothetical protein Pfl04_12580 [Planosporangium flavigriseum]
MAPPRAGRAGEVGVEIEEDRARQVARVVGGAATAGERPTHIKYGRRVGAAQLVDKSGHVDEVLPVCHEPSLSYSAGNIDDREDAF